MIYDIFISYKRKSLATANNLYYRLTTRGYSTFFDLEEMRRDNFNVQLLNYIENAKDVFVLLEEGSLDGCKQGNWEDDWFCKEIAHALKTKRNIIPILIGDYKMPKQEFFPNELQELSLKNAPEFSFSYFEEYLNKLIEKGYITAEAEMKRKHFVPVNPDKEFDGFQKDTPDTIRQCLGQHQFSSVDFEQLFQPSIDMMVEDRIKPIIMSMRNDERSMVGALVRIETDLDCRVLRFKEEIAVAKAGNITEIKLPKGKHKLTFEGVENKSDCYSYVQEVKDIEYEYYIEVNLLEKYNARKKFEREKYNGHEYVDLGLPSGLKWATCNVGASSPEQYGNYYAWGDISPKEEYDSDNYLSYCNETMDDIGGDKLYDVARESWGDSWRMPTCDECMELKDCCTWERIDQDGKKGCKVTGPNGNSIFLPATGFRRGLSVENKGEIGCYWSSTPDYGSWRECDTISTCSLFFDMYTKGVGYFKDRWFGQSVRPVSDKNFTM